MSAPAAMPAKFYGRGQRTRTFSAALMYLLRAFPVTLPPGATGRGQLHLRWCGYGAHFECAQTWKTYGAKTSTGQQVTVLSKTHQ